MATESIISLLFLTLFQKLRSIQIESAQTERVILVHCGADCDFSPPFHYTHQSSHIVSASTMMPQERLNGTPTVYIGSCALLHTLYIYVPVPSRISSCIHSPPSVRIPLRSLLLPLLPLGQRSLLIFLLPLPLLHPKKRLPRLPLLFLFLFPLLLFIP